MKEKIQYQLDKTPKGIIAVLIIIISIILGSVLANLLNYRDRAILEPLAMDVYYNNVIHSYRNQPVPWRILPGRIAELAGFILIYYWFHIEWISYLVLGTIAFSWGFLVSIEVIRWGIQGLLYGGVCLLPHSFLYGLSIVQLICSDKSRNKLRNYGLIILLLLLAICAELFLESQGIVRLWK